MIAWYAPLAALLPKYPMLRYPIVKNDRAAEQLFMSVRYRHQVAKTPLSIFAGMARTVIPDCAGTTSLAMTVLDDSSSQTPGS